ncbi:MAG: hypothetical protein OER56_13275 [Hyphomicrobiales bacterium]|nr:hypothetical protein [Hyphomicrobiales bacterium]
MTTYMRLPLSVAAGLAAALLAATPVMAKNLNHICATYLPLKKSITFDVSTGCTSSSYAYIGNNVNVVVDEERAVVRVTGRFDYQKRSSNNVAKADCMAAKRVSIEVAGVEGRRYRLMENGKFRGVVDFSEAANRQCIGSKRSVSKVGSVSIANAGSGMKLARQLLKTQSAATIQEIIAPLLAAHAISAGSRASLSLDINVKDDKAVRATAYARLTAHGLADDSVSGVRYTIGFASQGEVWRVSGMRRENMCARGSQAGQWTSNPCP